MVITMVTMTMMTICANESAGDVHFVDSSGQVWACVEDAQQQQEEHRPFRLELLPGIKLPNGGVCKLQARRLGQGRDSSDDTRPTLHACLGWDGSFSIENSSVMPEGITSFAMHEDVTGWCGGRTRNRAIIFTDLLVAYIHIYKLQQQQQRNVLCLSSLPARTGHLRIFITTSQGELSVVDVGDGQSAAAGLHSSSFEVRCLRLVEQGCRIVAALDYETQIVLQVVVLGIVVCHHRARASQSDCDVVRWGHGRCREATWRRSPRESWWCPQWTTT